LIVTIGESGFAPWTSLLETRGGASQATRLLVKW